MKSNLKKTGALLLIALICFACKKEQVQSSFADDAKSWYLKNNQRTNYSLISGKNEVLKVSQRIDWNKAQTVQLNDGTQVLSVPLSLMTTNGKTPNGSYMLMIDKGASGFRQLTVYNQEKDFFNNISKDKVQVAYSLGNQLSAIQKRANNNPGKGKIMVDESGGGMSDQPVCVNWYLVETFRDEVGNITRDRKSVV